MEIQHLLNSLPQKTPIVIASHLNIDGDGLGSMISLYLLLIQKKFYPIMVYDDTIPYFYHFLPNLKDILPLTHPRLKQISENTVFFAVDCSNTQRLGRLNDIREKCSLVVNIDHHPDNSSYGTINYVDPHCPSTTILIYQLAKKSEVELDSSLSMSILTGLITDTGGFQYVELNQQLLSILEDLINQGASVATIMRYAFKCRRYSALKLLGIALNHFVYDYQYHFGITYLLQSDFELCGASEEDAEGIVDYGLYIPGSLISVFIREVDNHSFKVSLRSQDETNILPIAHAFGGGGHLKAAGFKIQGDFKTVYHNLKEHIQGYLSSQSGTPHSLSV
ncbi:MAG TPA: DHH family phosphoesterase [Atribacter sp.]|jgi:phosphoesterase RecJ-like protein|nr:DHH family phosphoesterase [Candidatus Atribacteria bacterium]HOT04800.1 DHH family phosphoesterase [Atribacter sp.]